MFIILTQVKTPPKPAFEAEGFTIKAGMKNSKVSFIAVKCIHCSYMYMYMYIGRHTGREGGVREGGSEGGRILLTNILLADLLLLKFGQSCISFPLRKQRCTCISSVCVCTCTLYIST